MKYVLALLLLLVLGCEEEQTGPTIEEIRQESTITARAHVEQKYAEYEVIESNSISVGCNTCWNTSFQLRKNNEVIGEVTVTVIDGEIKEDSLVIFAKAADSFEDCEAQGFEIKDYYPRICTDEAGEVFEALKVPLINTSEKNTPLVSITFKPACVEGVKGGEIRFNTSVLPDEIIVQKKISGLEYEKAFSRLGAYEGFVPFSICENCTEGSFKLAEDKVHILRLFFKGSQSYQTNEYLIDTRVNESYLSKECKEEKIRLKRWG